MACLRGCDMCGRDILDDYRCPECFRERCKELENEVKQLTERADAAEKSLKEAREREYCESCPAHVVSDKHTGCKSGPLIKQLKAKLKAETKRADGWKEQYKQENELATKLLQARSKANEEIKQLKGEKPIPYAWWKDCPKLAQKTMERIIETNEQLQAKLAEAEKALQLRIEGAQEAH